MAVLRSSIHSPIRSPIYSPTVGKWGAVTPGPEPEASMYGWDSSYDEGTTGDWFVDGGVSSSGDGTSIGTAFKTIAEALSAASGGDVIRIKDHGSPYREQFSTSGKGGASSSGKTTITGYGTDKPTISGAEVITGWVACDAGDESVVGPNYASMFKKIGFDSTLIAGSDPRALNLHEAGEPMYLAIDRADNSEPFFIQGVETWHTADNVYKSGDVAATEGAVITALKDTSVTDNYTEAQIVRASVLLHVEPNVNIRVKIASFDAATDDIIRFTTTGTYENVNQNRWALINIIPAMEVGGYGYVDNGDSTCDIYIWPTDPDNITSGIEYSKRLYSISLDANNVEIRSLRIVQNATASNVTHGLGIKSTAVTKKSNNTLENLYVANHYAGGTAYGAISIRNIDNCQVHNVTIENVRGTYGIFGYGGLLTGSVTAADFMEDFDTRYIDVIRSEQSPFRFYTVRNHIHAWFRATDCGLGAHANKMNWYEQCFNVLAWGGKFINCDGYVTWQETTNIFLAFIYAPTQTQPTATTGSGRALQDQNNATNDPGDYLDGEITNLIFNCHFPPYKDALDRNNAFTAGSSLDPSRLYAYYNNVFHGDASDPTYVAARDYNVDTIGSANGAHSVASSVAAMYVNAATGDLTVKSDAPIRSMTGRDMSSDISTYLVPLFGSRFDEWTKDINGNEFDWSSAPVGEEAFVAVPDETAPAISTLSPADNATGVAVDATLVITFDEPVVAGTGNFELYDASDDSLVEAFDVTTDAAFDGSEVTLTPTSNLDNDTSYYVLADSGVVEDLSGNAFGGIASATAWNFTAVAASSAPFSLDWVARKSDLTDGASFTFTSVDFGDAPADGDTRYGLIAVQGSRTIATTFDSVTVNGSPATVCAAADNTIAHTAIYRIALPTGSGASHTVVVTCNFSQDGLAIDTFRMINPGSATPHATATNTATTANDMDLSLNIPTGGKAVAVQGNNDNSASTLTFTGLTATGSQVDLNSFDYFLSAVGGAAGTPHTVTASASGTPINRSGCAASWGP
jgi:hypothetical protein